MVGVSANSFGSLSNLSSHHRVNSLSQRESLEQDWFQDDTMGQDVIEYLKQELPKLVVDSVRASFMRYKLEAEDQKDDVMSIGSSSDEPPKHNDTFCKSERDKKEILNGQHESLQKMQTMEHDEQCQLDKANHISCAESAESDVSSLVDRVAIQRSINDLSERMMKDSITFSTLFSADLSAMVTFAFVCFMTLLYMKGA